MPPRCSICGLLPVDVGPLCVTECAWEAGRPWFECRRCTAEGILIAGDLRGLQETLADRADHYAACSFCWTRKALLRPGPLAIACLENTKKKEAEARRVA